MNPDVLVFAQVATIIVGLAGSLTTIAVLTYRAVQRINATHTISGSTHGGVDARLSDIQQSIDAIAVEVERIAEAQRFTAKLEAEREGRQSLPLSR